MSKARLSILVLFFFVFGALIMMRLFSIQIDEAENYQLKAARQQSGIQEQKRGDIFAQDKNGNLFRLATTQGFLRLYAIPSHIPDENEEGIINELEKRLSIPSEVLRERLSKKADPYEPLKERIPLEERGEFEKITQLFPEGLKLQEYKDRFYPYGTLASHVVGFVGFRDTQKEGLYGIEKFYNEELSGGGGDVVLNLDINVQRAIEETLQGLVEKWQAPSGSITVMRPEDGAVIAMGATPYFDPNNYQEVKDIKVFINPVVQQVFEPGSIVKPVTMISGLESGNITPQTTYVDNGWVERGGYVIKNAGGRAFGTRTMKEVLQFSINTGAIFVQEQVGKGGFLRTLENFGFGQATGIDLPGEAVGDMTNLDSGRPVNFATASFGQGISTSPLQILAALGAIANEGKLMKPRMLDYITHADGGKIQSKSEIRKVATRPEHAAQLTAMMTEVIQNGYDKKAQVPGYSVAGKTGTSQVPNPKGGYLETTIHSFVGFAPAYKPAFILLIRLDEPVGIRFASESIAPSFASLTQYLLQYYGVLPEKAVQP